MCVVTHHENAFYKCFSCGASGSCFDFVQNYLKLEFKESLQMLAERVGIELSFKPSEIDDSKQLRSKMKDAMSWASDEYQTALQETPEGNLASDLLKERGFTDESIKQFELGVAPDDWGFLSDRIRENQDRIETCLEAGLIKQKESTNRIYDAFRNRLMFPICNEFGDTIAFGGRRLQEEEEPKYINSPETELFHKSKTLFGYQHALASVRSLKKAIIVEGYTDVIACHQAGILNVVGTLGTAFTKDHASMLARICNEVVLVFDGDVAGQSAADRAIEIFFSSPIDVMICVLPHGKDPADLAFEVGTFTKLLEASVDSLTFKLNRLETSLSDQSSVTGRENTVQSFIDELGRLGFDRLSGIRKRFVYERIGLLLSMSMNDVEQLMQSQTHRIRSTSTPSSSLQEEQQIQPAISKKRMKAEYELLAVLLYDPKESSALIRESSREILNEQFLDPYASEIAAITLPMLKRSIPFNMQEILAEVTEGCKPTASTLYFEGERLSETQGSVILAVRSAMDAFFETLDNSSMKEEIHQVKTMSDPTQKAQAAQQTLEAIRLKKIARNVS